MFAPVLKLLATYGVIGLVVFGLFNRDAVSSMFRSGEPGTASAATAPLQSPDPAAAAPAPAQAAATPGQGAAPQPDAAPAGFDQMLNKARRLYWNGDKAGAVAAYEALIGTYPGESAGYGELGNIYYMQGDQARAADYFKQAAEVALAAGNHAEVSLLISVLRPLDREAAERLFEAQARGNQGAGE